jgi:peptidoglycan/LPS O-acetylase OafA/YrhL
MRLSDVFDVRTNTLNALRLVLASGVVLFHSFEVTGQTLGWWPARQFMQSFWVDGFFAVSGFLIVRSWMRRPDVRGFLRARALRILPAFYVCLFATAVVFAPVGALLAGINPMGIIPDALRYVGSNLGIYIVQTGIAGTPARVPYAGYWNVSLWTLFWEAACYVLVLIAGVTGLLRRSWTIPALAASAWLVALAGDMGLHHIAPIAQAARFGLMFLMGAMLFKFARFVPASWASAGMSAAVIIGSQLLPDYRLIAAPFVAHLVMVIGSRVTAPRLRFRNDLSYGTYIYGFPVQQLLVLAGAGAIGIPLFFAMSMVLTLCLAVLSWFFIERKALKWKAPAPHRGQRELSTAN